MTDHRSKGSPLYEAVREARESMAEMLEQSLRDLPEGHRLAVGPLYFQEGDVSMKCDVHVLKPGDDLADVCGQESIGNWTVYTPPPRLKFGYLNHRDEYAIRQVVQPRIYWGESVFYPGEQWLLEGFDMDRMDMLVFALNRADIGKDAI